MSEKIQEEIVLVITSADGSEREVIVTHANDSLLLQLSAGETYRFLRRKTALQVGELRQVNQIQAFLESVSPGGLAPPRRVYFFRFSFCMSKAIRTLRLLSGAVVPQNQL